MVWSTEDEMKQVRDEVKEFWEKLESNNADSDAQVDSHEDEGKNEEGGVDSKTGVKLAPGVAEDLRRNEGYVIDMSETSPLSFIPRSGQSLVEKTNNGKRKIMEEIVIE